jgi:hypothetical protein
MHLAWLIWFSSSSPSPSDVTFAARTAPKIDRSVVRCLFCEGAHPTDDCRSYRVERKDGQILVIKNVGKRTKKSGRQTSGLVISSEVSNSSFSVGSTPVGDKDPVLNTGTTTLFTSTATCDEYVIGVGGGRSQVMMKGTSAWGPAFFVPKCMYNLISYRSLIELGYSAKWETDCISLFSPNAQESRFQFQPSTGLRLLS